MNAASKVLELIRINNGILLTSQAIKEGISRQTLSDLASKGVVERVAHGVYIASDSVGDKLFYAQKKAAKLVYSHETALFFHKMTDRTPNKYSVTVSSKYKPSAKIMNEFKVFYIKPELYALGIITMPTAFGNTIRIYDAERTICDIMRSRNRLDIQIVNDALKKYVSLASSDYNKLYEYALEMGILSIVKQYLEVLI